MSAASAAVGLQRVEHLADLGVGIADRCEVGVDIVGPEIEVGGDRRDGRGEGIVISGTSKYSPLPGMMVPSLRLCRSAARIRRVVEVEVCEGTHQLRCGLVMPTARKNGSPTSFPRGAGSRSRSRPWLSSRRSCPCSAPSERGLRAARHRSITCELLSAVGAPMTNSSNDHGLLRLAQKRLVVKELAKHRHIDAGVLQDRRVACPPGRPSRAKPRRCRAHRSCSAACPVSTLVRAGLHRGTWVTARSNTVPISASRSMFGVSISG